MHNGWHFVRPSAMHRQPPDVSPLPCKQNFILIKIRTTNQAIKAIQIVNNKSYNLLRFLPWFFNIVHFNTWYLKIVTFFTDNLNSKDNSHWVPILVDESPSRSRFCSRCTWPSRIPTSSAGSPDSLDTSRLHRLLLNPEKVKHSFEFLILGCFLQCWWLNSNYLDWRNHLEFTNMGVRRAGQGGLLPHLPAKNSMFLVVFFEKK